MEEYKNKIIAFYRKHRRMPGYKEMMSLTGFKSKNAVYKLIQKLIDENIMSKDSSGHLMFNRSVDEIPVLGLVEAGFPTSVDEDITETMNIENYLIDKKESTYILEVKGDSMIDEGIKEGDLVIAERKGEPKDGDIVIAEVDGGWTMKFLRKKGSNLFLEPANKKYKPIYPKYDLKIAAIVKGVIRKY